MSLFSFYRISRPSPQTVEAAAVPSTYRRLRTRTFWGVSLSYSLYYMCRLSLSVVKQPLIDGEILTAGQLGIIGSALLFVYAFAKFFHGFIADYCNIRRFMATGLAVSAVLNLLLGVLGLWTALSSSVLMVLAALVWGVNGWAQSMGAAPGVISLSRWFPLSRRGTFYSIFSATPYLGEFVAFIVLSAVVGALGWQFGFFVSAAAGLLGTVLTLYLVTDTPESAGLPSIAQLCGEAPRSADKRPTRELQALVLRHPGIWVIALSSAFIYITKYALAGWGVLFLQKAEDFSLEQASQIIAFSSVFGILGTVVAGWLSDRVFRGDRMKPALLSGILAFAALGAFLYLGGGYLLNVLYVSVFSLSTGVLYCIVAGLMALDFVPRKATGAALGIVGISSYVAAGIQDLTSGFLIQGRGEPSCDFGPVSAFWMVSAALAVLLPVLNWKKLEKDRI